MTKETGGPFFPCKAYSGLQQEGITMREHYAGLAMQAFLPRGHTAEDTAKYSFAMANAMLQERNKP